MSNDSDDILFTIYLSEEKGWGRINPGRTYTKYRIRGGSIWIKTLYARDVRLNETVPSDGSRGSERYSLCGALRSPDKSGTLILYLEPLSGLRQAYYQFRNYCRNLLRKVPR